MRLIFSGFLILTVCFAAAQQLPVIVKDYNNCTVGLQNEKGEWIAQPVYSYIAPFTGRHTLVIRDGKRGLINIRGQETISTKWSVLAPVTCGPGTKITGLYLANNESDSTWVIDTLGNVLIASPLQFPAFFYDSVAVGHDKYNRYFFIHLDGKVIPLPQRNHKEPQLLSNNLYEFVNDSINYLHGVIDGDGKIIVPARFEDVDYVGGKYPRIIVTNEPYMGFYSIDGEVLWNCQLTECGYGFNNEYASEISAKYHGKWGIINFTGDTVVRFAFLAPPAEIRSSTNDTAYVVVTDSGTGIINTRRIWIVKPVYQMLYPTFYTFDFIFCKKDDKWGCLLASGNTIIDPLYDTILHDKRTAFFVSDSVVLAAEIDWGAPGVGVTQTWYTQWKARQKSKPGKYIDEDFVDYDRDSTVIYNDDWEVDLIENHHGSETYFLNEERQYNPYPHILRMNSDPQLSIIRIDPVDTMGDYVSYVRHYRGIPHWEKEDPVVLVVKVNGNGERIPYLPDESPYFNGNRRNYQYFNAWPRPGLVRSNGNIIAEPGRYKSYSFIGNVIAASDTTGFLWFLDSTGALVDKISGAWAQQYMDDTVWIASPMPATTQTASSWLSSKWQYALVDLSEKKIILDTALKITRTFSWDMKPVHMRTAYGDGIINPTTQKILVSPVYKTVQSLEQSGPYFVVRTCDDKIGISDTNNMLIADTVFRSIVQIHAPRSINVNNYKDSILPGEDSRYLLFEPGGKCAILSTTTGLHVIDTASRKPVIDELITQTIDTKSSSSKMGDYFINAACLNCTQNITLETKDTLVMWQYNYLYDMMFSGVGSVTPFGSDHRHDNVDRCGDDPNFQVRIQPANPRNVTGHRPLIIKGVTDSIMSIIVLTGNFPYEQHEHDGVNYVNIGMFGAGPCILTLDSLFIGNNWQQVITDSMIAYLSVHKEIDANCSKPDMMYKTVDDRFIVGDAGIYLYPIWDRRTDGLTTRTKHEIFVPWSALDPYLRPDIRTKLPAH